MGERKIYNINETKFRRKKGIKQKVENGIKRKRN